MSVDNLLFQFLEIYLYFIDILIDRLFVIYIICQILFFDNLKLLFILVNQKLLYLEYNSYICYILFVYFVQTKLYIKNSFNIDLYVFRQDTYYKNKIDFACRSKKNNRVCILNYVSKIFCYKIILYIAKLLLASIAIKYFNWFLYIVFYNR